jgi:hypothetical protein
MLRAFRTNNSGAVLPATVRTLAALSTIGLERLQILVPRSVGEGKGISAGTDRAEKTP